MNRIKKALFSMAILVMNIFSSYAHLGGRGRIDSGGPSDLVTILMLITGIVIGGFFFWGCAHDGFKDKEMNKIGCVGFILVVGGFLLLVAMCSR